MFGEEKLMLAILILLLVLCTCVYSIEEKREKARIEKERLELIKVVRESCTN